MPNFKNVFLFRFIFLLSLCFYLLPSHADEAGRQHLFLAGDVEPDSRAGRYLLLLYAEVFKRLDVSFEYRHYPLARASKMSSYWLVDGELARAKDYALAYQSLIRVDEPVYWVNVVAMAANPAIKLEAWQSLKNTDLTVNYRRGLYVAENALPKVLQQGSYAAVNNTESGLGKLLVGRSDIYIDVDVSIKTALESDAFKESPLYQAGVLERMSVHLFLAKQHEALALKVSETIKQLKREGLDKHYLAISGIESLSFNEHSAQPPSAMPNKMQGKAKH